MWTHEERPAFKPVLVICFPAMTREQFGCINGALEKSKKRLQRSGWLFIVLDGFDKMGVSAFGVPESKLGTLEELKKLIEESINKK